MNIIVVAYNIPRPDTHACQRRLMALLGMMASRHEVSFCTIIDGVDATSNSDSLTGARYQAGLKSLGIRLLPYGWLAAENVLRREKFDIGFFEYWRPAYNHQRRFRWLQPRAAVVVDSVDLHYAREKAAVDLMALPREVYLRNRWREIATYRLADTVIAISSEEAKSLQSEGAIPPVEVIPIVMPTRPRIPTTTHNLLFIGGFSHHPNLDGAEWLLRGIWPRVRREVPSASLTVVGSNPPDSLFELGRAAGADVVGYVPDTNPYLDRCQVSVAPLRYGGGMKGKVTEALAAGIPVVTTPVGAQGFEATASEHLLVAEGEEDFARACARLLTDPELCERVGRAGQKHVESLSSPDAIDRQLERLLREAAGRRARTTGMRVAGNRLGDQIRWYSQMKPRAVAEKLGIRFP